jgi:O-antigen/teichoic acid export membrane protein
MVLASAARCIVLERRKSQKIVFRFHLRTAAVIMLSHIITAIIGIASLRLLTGLATSKVFGEANLIMTFLTVISHAAMAPFSATVLRYQTDASARNVGDEFAAQAMAWSLASSGVVAAIIALGLVSWNWFGEASTALGTAAVITWLISSAAKNVVTGRLHAERRQLAFALQSVLEAMLLATFTAGALAIRPSSDMYLVGQAGAVAVTTAMVICTAPWPVLSGLKWPSRRGGFLEKVAGYGSNFAPLAIFGFLANVSDRYVLGFSLGPAAVGQYVAAFAISSRGIIMGNAALSDFFRPLLFDAENQADHDKARRVFLAWAAAGACMGVCALATIFYLGDVIVYMVLAQEYRIGAVEIMMWVVVGFAINGVTQIFENRLLSLGASIQLILPLVIGGSSNLVFSIILVSLSGVPGAAKASCASFAVQALVTGVILWIRLKERNPV